jgi:CheY-like chemotaxis protein
MASMPEGPTHLPSIAQHFSAEYKVPEPEPGTDLMADVDRMGMIGEKALRDRGYFTRIVVEDRGKPKRLLNPNRVRVLIVDDEESIAALIEKTLNRAGCRTLESKPLPHLVLLDVLMPDANGFDILNRIRQHPETQELPVVMLTSLGERKDITRGLALGATGYVTKPVRPSTLLEVVEAVVAG